MDRAVADKFKDHCTEARDASGGELRINCRWCGDNSLHLYVNPQKNAFHCFRCGRGGKLYALAKQIGFHLHEDDENALLTPAEVERFMRFIGSAERPMLPPLTLPLEHLPLNKETVSAGLGKTCYEYLAKRGFTLPMIEQYRLGYCVTGRYYERIIIPMFEHGQLVYYIARTIDAKQHLRYMNPPSTAVSKRQVVFNFDAGFWHDTVVLCEGAFDAMSVGENAVALMGKEATAEQIAKIARYKNKAIVLLDSDAGEAAMKVASSLQSYGIDVSVARLAKGDPNSATREEIDLALTNAVQFTGWEALWQKLEQKPSVTS